MKIFKLIFAYKANSSINSILYFLKTFPLSRIFFNSSYYGLWTLKKLLGFLSPIYLLLKELFFSLIKLGVFYLIPFLLNKLGPLPQDMVKIFFFNGLVIFSIIKLEEFSMTEDFQIHYVFHNYFFQDPKSFTLANLAINLSMKSLAYLLALTLFGGVFGLTGIDSLFLVGLSIFNSLASNAINASLISKGSYKRGFQTRMNLYLFFLASFLLGLSLYLGLDILKFSLPLLLLILVLSIWPLKVLLKMDKYKAVLFRIASKPDLEKPKVSSTNIYELNKLKKEDFETSKKHLASKNYQGYKLLNELFFQRHRRRLFKPILFKAGLLGLVFLIINLVYFLNIPMEIKEQIRSNFRAGILGFFPFIAYLLYFDQSIVLLMFTNCDQALMKYGFYRRPKDLLTMFKERLKKLIYWNSLISLVFFIGLGLSIFVWKLDIRSFYSGFIQIICLHIFFSVHTLFTYYFFQPFTGEKEIKSFGYSIINALVYLACYISLQIKSENPMIPIYYTGSALVYIIVAMILVYKKAPDRFKPNVIK